MFIGYRLCRRFLGPEEWMLGCLDAFRFAGLVSDLGRSSEAFGHLRCLLQGPGATWAQLGQTVFPYGLSGISV